ncbi:MAG: alanine racemase [Candidatus Zixiibacteriota bacterium]
MRDIRGHYLETISEVDLSAFRQNIEKIRTWVDNREIILAVKANAYGHGIVPICKEANRLGINKVGIANLAEGLLLRDSGVKCDIIMLTPPTLEQIPSIVHHGLIPNVTSLRFAEVLSQQSLKVGRKTKCHIEIDTGMGRSGMIFNDCIGDILAISRLKGIEIEGIFSHFPAADSDSENDHEFTMLQLRRFSAIIEKMKQHNFIVPLVHIANSAGILAYPIYGNAVRPGIMAFGLLPDRSIMPPIEIEPILTVKSQVIQIRHLPANWNISYRRTYRTRDKAQIAIIRMGYGDGLRLSASNTGHVLIRGKRRPIIGRICMDTTMVLINNDDNISLDDEVIIIGKQGNEVITASDHADWTNTINYEIITGISERVKRLYLRDGHIVGES